MKVRFISIAKKKPRKGQWKTMRKISVVDGISHNCTSSSIGSSSFQALGASPQLFSVGIDNAKNFYPVDNAIGFPNNYLLDRDLFRR